MQVTPIIIFAAALMASEVCASDAGSPILSSLAKLLQSKSPNSDHQMMLISIQALSREIINTLNLRKQACRPSEIDKQEATVTTEAPSSAEPTPSSLRARLQAALQTYQTVRLGSQSELSCQQVTVLLDRRVRYLSNLLRDLQQTQRFEQCMDVFKSEPICQQTGTFYVWAQQMARDILDGKVKGGN